MRSDALDAAFLLDPFPVLISVHESAHRQECGTGCKESMRTLLRFTLQRPVPCIRGDVPELGCAVRALRYRAIWPSCCQWGCDVQLAGEPGTYLGSLVGVLSATLAVPDLQPI